MQPALPKNRCRFCKIIFAVVILLSFLIAGCNQKRPSQKVDDISQNTIVPNPDINQFVTLAKIKVDRLEQIGQYLTDEEGRALYMFTGDNRSYSSACYVSCSEIWPPLLTTGDPVAAASAVKAELLGTIKRRDGSLQVTYNGWPLYYYEEDKGLGFAQGQDVNSFGGDWYLISPSGSYIAPSSTGNPKARGSWPKDVE